ncbi:hypothetical protein STAQ_43960 [Allostella sp. ATCC 35155]|nr:hypothetical protein STAQ_43960 [Stella sp. ATCC 35155]
MAMRGLALDMRVALGGGRQGAGAGIDARITLMTNPAATLLPPSVLEPFCRRWRIREFAVFGSILGPEFRPDSDIDVLVTFDPDADWSLIDLVRMEEELSGATGRRVDLLTRRGVEASRNPIRRAAILSQVRTLYAA